MRETGSDAARARRSGPADRLAQDSVVFRRRRGLVKDEIENDRARTGAGEGTDERRVDTSRPWQGRPELLHGRLIYGDDDDVRGWRRFISGQRDEAIIEPPIQASHDRRERQTHPENASGGDDPPCAAATTMVGWGQSGDPYRDAVSNRISATSSCLYGVPSCLKISWNQTAGSRSAYGFCHESHGR